MSAPDLLFHSIQLLNLCLIVLALALLFMAVFRIYKYGKGIEVPIWITLCLIPPILAPACALSFFPKERTYCDW